MEGRVSLRKIAGWFANSRQSNQSLTLSFSNFPVLRRPEQDEMQVDMTAIKTRYNSNDSLAFFFYNFRQVSCSPKRNSLSKVVTINNHTNDYNYHTSPQRLYNKKGPLHTTE